MVHLAGFDPAAIFLFPDENSMLPSDESRGEMVSSEVLEPFGALCYTPP
jgi:hypothetical protein